METLLEDKIIQKVISPAGIVAANDVLMIYVRKKSYKLIVTKDRAARNFGEC